MAMATEIVTMKTAGGVDKEHFISIVDGLEKNFHSKQPGFIDTELLHDEKNDEWIMIQHWEDLELMKAASKKTFNNPVTASFVNALNPKSVKMTMLQQVGSWSR